MKIPFNMVNKEEIEILEYSIKVFEENIEKNKIRINNLKKKIIEKEFVSFEQSFHGGGFIIMRIGSASFRTPVVDISRFAEKKFTIENAKHYTWYPMED